MIQINVNSVDQDKLENEFASRYEWIRNFIEEAIGTVSTELVASLLRRRRTWIERRLQAPGTPRKVSVDFSDVLALRYVCERLVALSDRDNTEKGLKHAADDLFISVVNQDQIEASL